MTKIINWLKYYIASLIDGNIDVVNNILNKSIRRDTDKLFSLTENEIKKNGTKIVNHQKNE